jgi:hypothetical protein
LENHPKVIRVRDLLKRDANVGKKGVKITLDKKTGLPSVVEEDTKLPQVKKVVVRPEDESDDSDDSEEEEGRGRGWLCLVRFL